MTGIKGRCDHEPVCWIHNLSKNPCKHKRCTNDTRSRPTTLERAIEDYSRELKERIIKSNLPSNCFDRLSLIIYESEESLRTQENQKEKKEKKMEIKQCQE